MDSAVTTPLPARSSPGRTALVASLICVAYYAGGMVSIALRFEPGGIAGIWLPHGILVAALLTTPVRSWWLYAAVLLPTHLHLVRTFQGAVPLTIMFIQFGGNILAAVLNAALLRRVLGTPPRLDSLPRMGALIAVGLLVPCLVSAGVARLFFVTDWVADFWFAWQRRTLASACSMVIVAPIVHLATGGLTAIARAPRQRLLEFAVLTAGLFATLLASFGWESARPQHLWLLFAPLPLLLASAVRFGPAGLGVHLLAIDLVAMLNTKAGLGPFVASSVAEVVLALQGFGLAISIPLMLLAALVQQHARTIANLRNSEARYRSLVEDQTHLICRFRSDGTYTFVNDAYCRYFERSAADMIGQSFWQFIPEAQQPAARAFLDSITTERPVATMEHEVIGPGGEVRWQHWTDRGLFDGHGRLVEYQAVGHDITERKRAEQAARDSEEQVRRFIQHSPAAVAMFDRDMNYMVYSRRWLTDYKLGDQNLAGRSHYEVFPEIPERWKEVHRRCLAGAIETCDEDPFPRLNGFQDWIRWEVRPWHRATGEIGGIIMFTEVITERMRAEEEHRELMAQKKVAEALMEVDRRKDEFLAILAHELRNPLTPMTFAVELMRSNAMADETLALARDIVARQTGQLTRLVDDLLDVSRITRGKVTLSLSVFDVRDIVAQAVETVQPLSTSRGQELLIHVPDEPLPIRGDRARVIQILSNLLNNAAKYTGDGGRIALDARRDDAHVTVQVRDSGSGIPPHMLGRVFDMFTQVEAPGHGPGLGIGLALVKQLVEMHGGSVQAHSDGLGHGSEFVLRLPLATVQEAAVSAPARALAESVGDVPAAVPRRRILIVDDNRDAAEMLSRLLRLQEHEVVVVHDGLSGLQTAQRLEPDVVFLDLAMPKLDGFEVARYLRLTPGGSRPLLVALTGFGRAEDRARTTAAGFDYHLTKPVDAQAINSLLNAL
jgi:PAS domain S-box-containing protein